MNKLAFLLIIAMMTTSLLAQPREGKRAELSVSGAYQNYSSGTSEKSTGAFLVSPRVGFFVVEGFEIEPEVVLMFASGSDPVYVLNGNVSYNFVSAGKGVPFILIGYGLANTVPLFGVPMTRTDLVIGVLNVGGGVKAFLRDDIALRIEYRYQGFSGEGKRESNSGYSYAQKVDMRIHNVQFGISVLL